MAKHKIYYKGEYYSSLPLVNLMNSSLPLVSLMSLSLPLVSIMSSILPMVILMSSSLPLILCTKMIQQNTNQLVIWFVQAHVNK